METYRFTLRLVLVLLTLTGLPACSVPRVGATPSRDTLQGFGMQQLQEITTPTTVSITSELPGEIQVISYPDPEVAIDSITSGSGGAADTLVAYEADVVLKKLAGGNVSIQAKAGKGRVPERLLLHVRVPHGSSIVINPSSVSSPAVTIDVIIAGEVKDVTAQVHQGNLTVRGATGNFDLSTGHGSISIDQRDRDGLNHSFELRANEGGITLFALNAKVNASTTNGSIQFVGTLRTADGGTSDNTLSEFNVKGAGDVSVALPGSAHFRYRAFGGARVIIDLAREAEPCGLLRRADYDFRRRPTSEGELGRIEIGGAITNTNQVQGTVGDGIIYFDTNRKAITVFDPPNPPPRSGGPSGSNTVGDCGRLSTDRLAANVDFTARAESGSIWIHQIKMKRQ